MQFIESNTTEDDFTEKLAQKIQKIKENKEWKVEYMTLLMREREKYDEGMAKGIEKGIEKGRAEGIKGIIEFALELNYSNDTILSVLRKKFNISTEQAKEYLNRYYKKNF